MIHKAYNKNQMRSTFWISSCKVKQPTCFRQERKKNWAFRYTQMQLNKHCSKQKKKNTNPKCYLANLCSGNLFFSQVFESIAMRVKLLVVIRSLPISLLAVLCVFWVWIPEEAVGGDGGGRWSSLYLQLRHKGAVAAEDASDPSERAGWKSLTAVKKSQIWPGL